MLHKKDNDKKWLKAFYSIIDIIFRMTYIT